MHILYHLIHQNLPKISSRKVFPHSHRDSTPVTNSALARIKEKRECARLRMAKLQDEGHSEPEDAQAGLDTF